ncbi:MAG: sugar ABC transporter ATP-binding protein [Bacteroidales bacterium]|nr:sugar ABC transporter ATP-binding protein [Bacteroidales bacterium]
MSSDGVLIQATGITKRFPGTVALDGVDFCVRAGRVHSLVGENGAGKSTLMNILSGVYGDYEGKLDIRARGVAMIHQELNLVPEMTVAENIFLGREPRTALGLVDRRRMERNAAALLQQLGAPIRPGQAVRELRVGEQQIVEIAKTLSQEAEVLIMDEPTSSLSERETRTLFDLIRDLKAKGNGIVYITHKMSEVSALSDEVTILRDGRLVKSVPFSQTSIAEIIRGMVGREGKDFFVKNPHGIGDCVLEMEGLCLDDTQRRGRRLLEDISLQVRAGEVLGIYGLMGAGRSELLGSVFGLYPDQVSGKVRIGGTPVRIRSPRDAVRCGMALLPEDRKQDGLVMGMDITRNTTLAALESLCRHGLTDTRAEKARTDEYRSRLGIRSHSNRQTAGELSGGNQQKVVLAKWLLTNPRVLFLDEPTRGIDISAKNEIYKLMDELSASGMALVVVSSELPEIMAVSDRIVTLRDGRIGAEFPRERFTEESILKAALPAT